MQRRLRSGTLMPSAFVMLLLCTACWPSLRVLPHVQIGEPPERREQVGSEDIENCLKHHVAALPAQPKLCCPSSV